MLTLLLTLLVQTSFAHASSKEGVARALIAYDSVISPNCGGLLHEGRPDFGRLRDPAGFKAEFERIPNAQLLRGDLDRLHGIFIAVFPERNPARLSFTILYAAPVPWLLRYQDELERLIVNLRIDGALILSEEHPPERGPYMIRKIRGNAGGRPPAGAAINTQFSLNLKSAPREVVKRVARELLDWDESIRAEFHTK